MKLLYAKGTCALSVHVLLEEMKQDYEAECVSIDEKTVINHFNPLGYVPVLVLDSGEVVTEAAVILQFLAEGPKGTPFFPNRGSMERIRCLEWLVFTSTELHQKLGPLFHRDIITKEFEELTVQKVEKRLAHMDRHLSKNKFLVGNQYTIADMYAVAILRIGDHVKLKLSKFEALAKYKRMMEELPVIKKIIEIEDKAPTITSVKAA